MLVNQIAVFLENQRGKVKGVTDVLKKAGINLLAVSIADTKDFGILRAITDNNEEAIKVLKSNGYVVLSNDLIGVEVENKPGGLGEVLGILDELEIDIEYLYSYVVSDGKAIILFKVSDVQKTVELIKAKDVKLIETKPY
ncbi:MAG: ACT domain-containing protein [Clostridia bacterium]|nr:ACT domain-containing protein [Clostridia bacterium]